MSTLEDLIRTAKELERLAAELADHLFNYASEQNLLHQSTPVPPEARITESATTVFQKRVEQRDPVAVMVAEICACYGLEVRNDKQDGSITCVSTLDRIWAMSPKLLQRTLETVTNAWGRTPANLRGDIIEGTALFLMQYGDTVDTQELSEALSSIRNGTRGLLASAQILQRGTTKSRTRAIADLIADVYTS